MPLGYWPSLEMIETAPSDDPQANIKPKASGAQHTEFTKKKCNFKFITSEYNNIPWCNQPGKQDDS